MKLSHTESEGEIQLIADFILKDLTGSYACCCAAVSMNII